MLITDISNNIILVHIKKNRFITQVKNTPSTAIQFLDKNFILFAIANTQRKIDIYNIQGNKLESLDGHRSSVFKIQCNFQKEQFITISKDSLNIWDQKTFTRIKTLNPHKTHFKDAFYTKDAQGLTTIFEDHTVYEWNQNTFELRKELQFPTWSKVCDQSSYDKFYFIGGKKDQIWAINPMVSNYKALKQPNCTKHVEAIQSLAREHKFAFLADDNHICIVDMDRNNSVVGRVGNAGNVRFLYDKKNRG